MSSPAKTKKTASSSSFGERGLRRVVGGHSAAMQIPAAGDPVWAWMDAQVSQRKAGETLRVEMFTPAEAAHCWLLVLMDDQVFLTDTISLAVRRHGVDVLGLWHPVVAVERERGALVDAATAKDLGRKKREAWILLQLGGVDDATGKVLKKDLQESLTLAAAAVRDFEPMQAKMTDVADGYAKGVERAFLQWLVADNMVFLGYRHYDYKPGGKGLRVQVTAGSGLGILSVIESSVREAKDVSLTGTSLGLYVGGPSNVIVSKTPDNSRVHRSAPMDYVAVLERNAKGQVVGEHRFLGLYTSRAYTTAVREIPLLRDKVDAVMKETKWPRESYNARSLTNVLETWPRDELFLTDVPTLTRLATTTVAVHERPDVCVLLRTSEREQAASVIVYLPVARMNTRVREDIEKLLSERFGTPVREYKLERGSDELAHLHFRLPWFGKKVDEAALTQDVRALVRGWDDEVFETLVGKLGAARAVKLRRSLVNGVSAAYKDATPAASAVEDLLLVSKNVERNVSLAMRADGLHLRLLRRGQSWLLADLMPLVDSCGLAAVSEQTFRLGEHWLHEVVCVAPTVELDSSRQTALIAVLDACLAGTFEKDSMNRLAIGTALGVREIGVWRAWTAFAQQVDRRLDPRMVRRTVRVQPELARTLWELFEARHNPALSERKRALLAKPRLEKIETEILAMPTAEQERVWRTLLTTVMATLRTNVFTLREGEAMAFKLDCSKVYGLVEPKPWREIFVYHPDVEGVHLRGGRVARGGLRHSDRPNDYRTEILALMTAQMRKNTVIVPVGAKGGFYIRAVRPGERAADAALVKACYQKYIRALLSVTDTYAVDGGVVAPRVLIRHDGDDPYLVVAADKGTAKFSDTANGEAIAADYWDGVKGGFWLGDAFASGGSKGYDHKEMGITARGAWVSVAHHLAALNLTPSKQRPITIVGVGDMAGDVFGNGLLRDENVQLVAAFNHIHIFLDPDPDPAASFKERQRMFDAGLGWEGYNTKLLSAGGGIYLRNAKSIPLSARMQERLGVRAKQMTPEQLVSALLKAPVDVLWNGGIGTYIKASDEPQSAAADKANDDVRVDATQVQAKVIGEGGNLGITPRGRVELARHGVALNTDALDNSAGVDTSDHEVNLKILLQVAMRAKKLDEAGRVKILRAMTDDVAELVLRDNSQQNLVLTLDANEGEEYHRELHEWQETLVDKGVVDMLVDCLPTARELANRKPALYTRPELAALLAGTKAWLRAELLKTPDLMNSRAVQPLLARYFPKLLQDKFGDLIVQHPLADEIVATVLTNLAVNRLGILAIPRLMGDFDASAADVMRSLSVVVDISSMDRLWVQLDELVETISHEAVMAVSQRLKLVTVVLAAWVLRHGQPVDVEAWRKSLREPCRKIIELLPKALKGRPEMAKWADEWQSMGLPETMAVRMALLSPIVIAPDVAMIAAHSKKPLVEVLATHLKLGEMLKLPALVRKVRSMAVPDGWTRQAVQAMGQELFTRQMRLTEYLLKHELSADEWMSQCDGSCQRYYSLVKDILQERHLSVAMLSVLLGRLRELER